MLNCSGFMSLSGGDDIMSEFATFAPTPAAPGFMPRSCDTGMCGIPEQDPSVSPSPMLAAEEQEKKPLKINGITKLSALIGEPDVVDGKFGGIAIWSSTTLKSRGYGFLRRVEIIDEAVPSMTPVKHYSNVYAWIPMSPSTEQLANILGMSKNYFYDRKKKLMVVRSSSLDRAIAQGAALILYITGKFSFYKMKSNELLKVFFEKAKKRKQRRAIYTIVNAYQNQGKK